jgi:hypothetical protein
LWCIYWKRMVKILFFIFISFNLIYHVIILNYEFQESKCNVLEVLFYWDDVQMKNFFFFCLECFIIMLFVVFSLSPLKAMVYNLDFNLLVCDCECVILTFRKQKNIRKVKTILNTRLTLIILYTWILNLMNIRLTIKI